MEKLRFLPGGYGRVGGSAAQAATAESGSIGLTFLGILAVSQPYPD